MSKSHSRRKLFECLVAILRGNVPDQAAYLEEESYWHSLLPLADLHRIVPALPSAIRKVGVWDQVPESVSAFLNAIHELNVDRSRELAKEGLGILDLLEKAGIQVVPVKGLTYELIDLHRSSGSRLTGDIDLLVAQKDCAMAQRLIIAQGYVPKFNEQDGETDRHHLPGLIPTPKTGRSIPIEVHYRLGQLRHLQLLPPDEILSNARVKRIKEQTVRIPRSVDLLQHAVVHSGLQHKYLLRRTTRLRDVLDIGRLWALTKTEVDSVSDLPLAKHRRAAEYFGACLLLYGTNVDELGPLTDAAKSAHVRILQRQAINERTRLERSIVGNWEELLDRPTHVARKFLASSYHRKIIRRFQTPKI